MTKEELKMLKKEQKLAHIFGNSKFATSKATQEIKENVNPIIEDPEMQDEIMEAEFSSLSFLQSPTINREYEGSIASATSHKEVN